MLFINSTIFKNIDKFNTNRVKLMRTFTDMILIWQTVEHFQPKHILEIGFAAGQTFGLLIEGSPDFEEATAIDIDSSNKDIFDSLFPNVNYNFINEDSQIVNLNKKYDLIHIDGNHNYKYVVNDMKKSLTYAHKDSILIIDDYMLDDVDRAISDVLNQSDFIPFLKGDNSLFFAHNQKNVSILQDELIFSNDIKQVLSCSLQKYKNNDKLLEARFLGNYIFENADFRKQLINLYKEMLNNVRI